MSSQLRLLRRRIALWKRSGTSLDLIMWSAQRLEILAMDEFKSTLVRGVNAPENEKPFSNYPAHRQRTLTAVALKMAKQAQQQRAVEKEQQLLTRNLLPNCARKSKR